MKNDSISFTFCVLAYNHENYIIEHLESIRYLVESYALGADVRLIVNDDCSLDSTRTIMEKWLLINGCLFSDILVFNNEINKGTVKSVINVLKSVMTSDFKLTAADDVYSFENIFVVAREARSSALLSGVPFRIINGEMEGFSLYSLSVISSYIVYKNRKLRDRVRELGAYNAPNMFYNSEYIKKSEVLDFLADYLVVEDWPLNTAIASYDYNSCYELTDKVIVYYRRTSGSTYLIASEDFNNDQEKLFRYLIDNEDEVLRKYFLKLRLQLFKSKSIFIRRIFNAPLWIFALKCVFRFNSIYRFSKPLASKELFVKHVSHYSLISSRATDFFERP